MINITIPSTLLEAAVINTLNLPKELSFNFHNDLYFAIREQLIFVLENHGLKVKSQEERTLIDKGNTKQTILFNQHPKYDEYERNRSILLSSYGYLSNTYNDTPSLNNLNKIRYFGSYMLVVEAINLNEVSFTIPANMDMKRVDYNFGKKIKKPYIYFQDIDFKFNHINHLINKHSSTQTELRLDEWRHEYYQYAQASGVRLFVDRYTGHEYICRCFMFKNNKQYTVLDNICHFCNRTFPVHPSHGYYGYSDFKSHYSDYYGLMAYQHGVSPYDKNNDLENKLREHFGYPKIGKTGIKETFLFQLVSRIFANETVIRRYRGKELGGLELDIWLPNLQLAIEYQGIQHYQSVEHWGGMQALIKRQENDFRKRRICQELGYTVLEISGEINIINVIQILKPYWEQRNPDYQKVNCTQM